MTKTELITELIEEWDSIMEELEVNPDEWGLSDVMPIEFADSSAGWSVRADWEDGVTMLVGVIRANEIGEVRVTAIERTAEEIRQRTPTAYRITIKSY